MTIKVGDIVRLASGSPDMTVGLISGDGTECYWFCENKHTIRSRYIPVSALVKVERKEPPAKVASDNDVLRAVPENNEVWSTEAKWEYRGDWKERRTTDRPFQEWHPFLPDTLVAVQNCLGDETIGYARDFWWGWEDNNPEGGIVRAREVVLEHDPIGSLRGRVGEE